MNINDAFPSKYLKASDLKGRTVRLTISDYAMVELGQGADSENKPVLFFKETKKGMVLNKTKTFSIGDSYGEEFDNWKGRSIEVFPGRTAFGGKMVDCIEVRIPQTPSAPPAAQEPADQFEEQPGRSDDDGIPF